MMRVPTVFGLALLAAFSAVQTFAQDDTPGLAIGKRAPAFSLKDQQGKDVTLKLLLKKNNVAIVFYRSASW